MAAALKAASQAARRWAGLAAAALALALIGGLAVTGGTPGRRLQQFVANGIVSTAPSEIGAVEIRQGSDRLVFRRAGDGAWRRDETLSLSADAAAHLETALRFLHVSAATRALARDEWRDSGLAAFGLDPPETVVSLFGADGALTVVDFGSLDPTQTVHYARVLGQSTVLLLPRHVAGEWQLATEIAKRDAPQATDAAATKASGAPGFLLPVPIEAVWAVEIVAGGKLARFERDGAGRWFLHTGQHSHADPAAAHIADPARAEAIGRALAGFGNAQVERTIAGEPGDADLARARLARPALIALLYARDSSTALARVEFGKEAEDGFGRFARLAPRGPVVIVAEHEARRLVGLASLAEASR